jgi:hypothetical protein
MVEMWMWSRGQVKLPDQIRTYQVVVAFHINDESCMPIFDGKENLKQVMALQLLCFLHLCTKNSLYNNGLVIDYVVVAK